MAGTLAGGRRHAGVWSRALPAICLQVRALSYGCLGAGTQWNLEWCGRAAASRPLGPVCCPAMGSCSIWQPARRGWRHSIPSSRSQKCPTKTGELEALGWVPVLCGSLVGLDGCRCWICGAFACTAGLLVPLLPWKFACCGFTLALQARLFPWLPNAGATLSET
jgi:hypothetical protein